MPREAVMDLKQYVQGLDKTTESITDTIHIYLLVQWTTFYLP
jgi:hypothetical protein